MDQTMEITYFTSLGAQARAAGKFLVHPMGYERTGETHH
jgi:hypothetical protein